MGKRIVKILLISLAIFLAVVCNNKVSAAEYVTIASTESGIIADYYDANGLIEALEKETNIKLMSNISLDVQKQIKIKDKDINLDLNNKEISIEVKEEKEDFNRVFAISKNGKMTVQNGTITVNSYYGLFEVNEGELVVNSGKYIAEGAGASIYVNSGILRINNGLFQSGITALNIKKIINANVKISGGTFKGSSSYSAINLGVENEEISEEEVFATIFADGKELDNKRYGCGASMVNGEYRVAYLSATEVKVVDKKYDVTVASKESGIVADYYDKNGLTFALQHAQKVKLLSDIEDKKTYSIEMNGNKCILDLNGYEIKGNTKYLFKLDENSTLQIRDASKGSGEITNKLNYIFNISGGKLIIDDGKYNNKELMVIHIISGELIINNGNFNGYGIIKCECGGNSKNKQKIVINNGIFNTTNGNGVLAYSGDIEINNGKFSTYSSAVEVDAYDNELNLIINNGNFETIEEDGVISSASTIRISGGNVRISNGKFYSENGEAVFVQDAYNNHGLGNKVVIDGGRYYSKRNSAIATSGNNNKDYELIVNDGEFESEEYCGIEIGSFPEPLTEDAKPRGYFVYPTKGFVTKINGGKFIGYYGGLHADYAIETLINFIKGGTFIATSTNADDFPAALCGFAGLDERHSINELIAEGYEMYDDNTTDYIDYGENYVYSYTKAKKVEVRKKEYQISYEVGNGVKITPMDSKIGYGDSKEYQVSLQNGYDIEKIMVNNKEIALNNNKFTLQNVKEDIKIIIKTKAQENYNNGSTVEKENSENNQNVDKVQNSIEDTTENINVNTGDNKIMMFVGILVISLIGICITIKIKKHVK